MRKAIALALFLCLFAGLTVNAEKNADPLSESEIYTLAQKCAVSIEATRGTSSIYLNGVVIEGSSKQAIIVSSLDALLLGYDKYYLHFENSKARKKASKVSMDFEHNLVFLKFTLSSKYFVFHNL